MANFVLINANRSVSVLLLDRADRVFPIPRTRRTSSSLTKQGVSRIWRRVRRVPFSAYRSPALLVLGASRNPRRSFSQTLDGKQTVVD
jgi:hypothetical protein